MRKNGKTIQNVNAKKARQIIGTSVSYIRDKTKSGDIANIKGWDIWRV